MSASPDQKQPVRGTSRVPRSFFYDRIIPVLLVVLAIILAVVMVLVIGALIGVIPIK